MSVRSSCAELLPLVAVAALLAMGRPVFAGTDQPVGGGNEPIVTVVNPLNPANVAVGSGGTLRLSTDFGQSFPISMGSPTPASLQGQGYFSRGDSVLAFDAQGTLHWTYLLGRDDDNDGSLEDQTVCAASVNPMTGAVLTAVDVAPGDVSDDKPWIAADANPASPFANNVYIVWTRLTGTDQVLFARSVDGGATYSPPQQISNIQAQNEGGPPPAEGFVWPSHVAVAHNGDVYASYHTDNCDGSATAGRIPVIRDGSGGANLASGILPQKTYPFGDGQATVTCNVQDSSGDEIPQTAFWMIGSAAPYVLPDPVRPGHVYVIANDDPNDAFGSGDDGEVVMARSTDHGNTWTRGPISHGPADSLQVFPTGAIDQDGNLVVHWYDNRLGATNSSNNWLLDRFATVSLDGGMTFSNDFKVNDAPFDPDLGAPCRFGPQPPCASPGDPVQQTLRIGEYHGIYAVDGIAYATWTGNSGGSQQILFDLFSIPGAIGDRLEPNESTDFAVAASLGSDDTYNEAGLSIHSATDVDFFKVVALHTGKLQVEIEYNELINNLSVRVRDRFENVVATGSATTLQTGSTVSMLAIPVVQGETYFVEVFDPAAPGAFAPQSLYDLTIINRIAPVPFELDLRASSDTGKADDDNTTSDDTPTIQLRVDDADFLAMGINFSPTNDDNLADDAPGFKVAIFDNGNLAGYATPVAGQPGVYEFTFPAPLSEASHSITARVIIIDPSDNPDTGPIDHFVGQGGESQSLLITVVTTPPAAPPNAPDLLPSSDSGGIDIDNITTIMAPAFKGTAPANSIVRIRANGEVVGEGTAGSDATDGVPNDGLGAYEITVEPLVDGVYDITAETENMAGLISPPSAALQVTIANQTLNLSGANAGVVIDLASSTLTGYPGIPGGIVGIAGIPTVNLDVNGQGLTVDGTALADTLIYTPTGSQSGQLTRTDSPQVLNFSAVGGTFLVDPLGGADAVVVNGTVQPDGIEVMANPMTTVQVNSLLAVELPIANVESLVVLAGSGDDNVHVGVPDSVNANMFVDGGDPATNQRLSDRLVVEAISPNPRLLKQPANVKGAGAIFVAYPRTTGNMTRINYVNVERAETTK